MRIRVNLMQKEKGDLHILFACVLLVLLPVISIGIGYGLQKYTISGRLETFLQPIEETKNEIFNRERGLGIAPVFKYKIISIKRKDVPLPHESNGPRKDQDLRFSKKDITRQSFKQRYQGHTYDILKNDLAFNTANGTRPKNTNVSLSPTPHSPKWLGETKEKNKTSSEAIYIKAVKFKKEKNQSETILLYADRFFEPTVFGLDGINPYGATLRLVVDIGDASYINKKYSKVSVEGRIIKQIRFHHDGDVNKLRMVIDLESAEGYTVDQFFYSKENIYRLNISLKKDVASKTM
jgi:hypothetical protein